MEDKYAQLLSEYIASTNYENLSKEAIETAKKSLLDTMGAMIAGSTSETAKKIIELISGFGGKEEAHIFRWNNKKVPAPMAALCNGVLSRAKDIDDCLDYTPVHPTLTIIPVLFALSEMKKELDNKPLNGKDFITAIVIGQDINIRFSLSIDYSPLNLWYDNTFRILGPVAALANALKMDAHVIQKLMGMAVGYGTIIDGPSVGQGADSTKLYNGMLAYSALLYTLLAHKGISGPADYLMKKSGYLSDMHPNCKLQYITDDLGKKYYSSLIIHKPFSACRAIHNSIGVAVELHNEIKPEEVRKIEVRIVPSIYKLLKLPRGVEIKPSSGEVAEISIPFTVATAIVKGDFFLKELENQNLNDKRILDLAKKIFVVPDINCQSEQAVGSTVVDVFLENGKTISKRSETALGSVNKPMDYFDGIANKFIKCLEFSKVKLSRENIYEAIEKIYHIEDLDDVCCLIKYLL